VFEYVEKNLLEVLEENTVGIDVSTPLNLIIAFV
jgi:cyclin-dependent kinase-like